MKRLAAVLALSALSTFQAYAGQWTASGTDWSYIKDDGYPIKEGWFVDTDGKKYCFNGGIARTGWYGEYYFDKQSAELKTGWINSDGKWYYSGIDGMRQKGWIFVDNNWYYTKNDGQIYTDTVVQIAGAKYYFTTSGSMARSAWVADDTYYADDTGRLATSMYVDSTYVGKDGKVSDTASSKKRNIANKVYSDSEYMEMASDSIGRYSESSSELLSLINDYREDYNDRRVYNYTGDDDDYYDKNELDEFEEDSTLTTAAAIRAVELASQQRASGARPNGKQPSSLLEDSSGYVESVAFGQTDAQECYDALKSGGTHTGYWERKEYTRVGIASACDANGKLYWVVIYGK